MHGLVWREEIRICGCCVCIPCSDLIENPDNVQRHIYSTLSGHCQWAAQHMCVDLIQPDDCWLPSSWSLCSMWRLPSPSTRNSCSQPQHGHSPFSWRWHSGDREKFGRRKQNSNEHLSHSRRISVAKRHHPISFWRGPVGRGASVLSARNWQNHRGHPEDREWRTLHWVQVCQIHIFKQT